jgi:hypothetical protein
MPMLIDRPPPGWFVLSIMRTEWRKWDWVALMVDVDPDDHCSGERPARQNAGSAFPASTGIVMPPGTRWKT